MTKAWAFLKRSVPQEEEQDE